VFYKLLPLVGMADSTSSSKSFSSLSLNDTTAQLLSIQEYSRDHETRGGQDRVDRVDIVDDDLRHSLSPYVSPSKDAGLGDAFESPQRTTALQQRHETNIELHGNTR